MDHNWFNQFPTDRHYCYCSNLLFPRCSNKWPIGSILVFFQRSHCLLQFPHLLHVDSGTSPERQNKCLCRESWFSAKWNKIKSSLPQTIWREWLLWAKSIRIINFSWHRSWEEAAQAAAMGFSLWDVDCLYWKQKMQPYKSVIVTPILTGRELLTWSWFSLPAYNDHFCVVFLPYAAVRWGSNAGVVVLSFFFF